MFRSDFNLCNTDVQLNYLEQEIDQLLQLTDTVEKLSSKLSWVRQALEDYETNLIVLEQMIIIEPGMYKLMQQLDTSNLRHWLKLVGEFSTELNALSPPRLKQSQCLPMTTTEY